MNSLILSIIKFFLIKNITFNVSYSREYGICWYFDSGFYKSDSCTFLYINEDDVFLETRYGGTIEINSIDDIINESFSWYTSSKTKFKGWAEPHEKWKPLYNQLELL
jgi:hypothetical protein